MAKKSLEALGSGLVWSHMYHQIIGVGVARTCESLRATLLALPAAAAECERSRSPKDACVCGEPGCAPALLEARRKGPLAPPRSCASSASFSIVSVRSRSSPAMTAPRISSSRFSARASRAAIGSPLVCEQGGQGAKNERRMSIQHRGRALPLPFL